MIPNTPRRAVAAGDGDSGSPSPWRLALGISLRWLQLALTWLLTPSDDAVKRREKLEKKRRIKAAQGAIRGR